MSTGERQLLAVASAACLLLVPVQLGWIPALRHAWGLQLWLYLPTAASALLALAVLALCWPGVQDGLARAAAALRERLEGRGAALLLVLPLLFWLLRERLVFGDSELLLYTSAIGHQFSIPDVGATWFFNLAARLGRVFGEGPLAPIQVFVCLAGGVAVACVAGGSRYLAATPGERALVAALILCGGLLRTLAGHVEVYAFVLAAAAAYLWAALAHLAGRAHWSVPCAALGVGLWVHFSFAFLTPTLLLLFHLKDPSRGPARHAARGLAALPLLAAPTLLFLLLMAATGHGEDLERGWTKLRQILGLELNPYFANHWVLAWGEERGAITEYAIFSREQFKYLVNAFFVLAPASVPLLAGFACLRPRALLATPEASFLSAAALCTALYAFVLIPLWGPYDWDLFSLSAFCLAALAAHLVVGELAGSVRARLCAILLGASLLFVTLPFLWVGTAPSRHAGPFTEEAPKPADGESGWEAFQRRIEPWL
jgi:hypothetical protein